jgi:hypothetical protein
MKDSDDCKTVGGPFFFKQIDKVLPIPDDFMVREFAVKKVSTKNNLPVNSHRVGRFYYSNKGPVAGSYR